MSLHGLTKGAPLEPIAEMMAKAEANGTMMYYALARLAKEQGLEEVSKTFIEAANMDEVITISIDGFGTITFCGNDFAILLARHASTATLGAALYNYGVKAKACFTPNQEG